MSDYYLEIYTYLLLVSALLAMVGSGGLLWLWRADRRQLPAAEQAEIDRKRAEEQAERDHFRLVAKEARYLAKEIPQHLAIQNQMTWNYHETRRDGRRKKKKSMIRFQTILLTRTEIWFKIDGRRLPYGTSFADIKKPENNVKDNLQHAIHRPVQFHEDYEFNFFIRVGLKNSVMGIPKRVTWAKAFEALPKSNPFAVAVGVNDNNKVIYQDLRRWPHGIVAGSTEQGKSVQMTQWIITLMARNSPAICQFILVDLKDGVELMRFRNAPHVRTFIDEKNDVMPVLIELEKERQRRMMMFKDVCQNINGWNAQMPNKLPYIFLIVDELADLMLDKNLKNQASDLLGDLARKARAAGIHMILATQILEAQVLNLQIRGNFLGRCCFSVPSPTESMLVVNNGLAANLGLPGRCVYKHGAGTMILQAPIATDDEIERVIAEVSGPAQSQATDRPFDEIDLLKAVLYNHEGIARAKELWEDVGEHMSKNRIAKTLKSYEFKADDPEGSVIELDGGRYILTPTRRTAAGNQPRTLLAVNGVLPKSNDECFQWLEAKTQNPEHEFINQTHTPTEIA